jgi:hypothetical protein
MEQSTFQALWDLNIQPDHTKQLTAFQAAKKKATTGIHKRSLHYKHASLGLSEYLAINNKERTTPAFDGKEFFSVRSKIRPSGEPRPDELVSVLDAGVLRTHLNRIMFLQKLPPLPFPYPHREITLTEAVYSCFCLDKENLTSWLSAQPSPNSHLSSNDYISKVVVLKRGAIQRITELAGNQEDEYVKTHGLAIFMGALLNEKVAHHRKNSNISSKCKMMNSNSVSSNVWVHLKGLTKHLVNKLECFDRPGQTNGICMLSICQTICVAYFLIPCCSRYTESQFKELFGQPDLYKSYTVFLKDVAACEKAELQAVNNIIKLMIPQAKNDSRDFAEGTNVSEIDRIFASERAFWSKNSTFMKSLSNFHKRSRSQISDNKDSDMMAKNVTKPTKQASTTCRPVLFTLKPKHGSQKSQNTRK